MTLKEAKKILKKEGFELEKVGRPCSPNIIFTAYESPEICEAMQVVCSASYSISMVSSRFDDRKARLSLELAENSAPMPGPDEEQPKEGNHALKEAASQFNDALLDEQAKEIKCIKEKNLRLGKEIARLNKNIYKKNMKIEELRKESSRHLRGKIKMFGENVDLEQMLKDKDAVLSDVAEELRLSKIREKNLTEVSQKYMKENEELKKELAGEAKRVEMIRNASKEYCDYGVAANEFIKELASLYVIANNKGIINDEMLERCKNYQTYGFPANCNRETKKEINDIARGKTKVVGVDNAEEGGDHSAIIAQCYKDITTISKDEAEIIERCTKNGTELHYSEKDGFTYTNMYGEEMPIRCLRGMFHVFTDEKIKNMKK